MYSDGQRPKAGEAGFRERAATGSAPVLSLAAHTLRRQERLELEISRLLEAQRTYRQLLMSATQRLRRDFIDALNRGLTMEDLSMVTGLDSREVRNIMESRVTD